MERRGRSGASLRSTGLLDVYWLLHVAISTYIEVVETAVVWITELWVISSIVTTHILAEGVRLELLVPLLAIIIEPK